jgi:hypothetical protein
VLRCLPTAAEQRGGSGTLNQTWVTPLGGLGCDFGRLSGLCLVAENYSLSHSRHSSAEHPP